MPLVNVPSSWLRRDREVPSRPWETPRQREGRKTKLRQCVPPQAGNRCWRKSCDELIRIASQKANSQISSEVRKWVCGWEMKVCSPFLLFYRRIASQKAKWRWSIFLFFAKRLYSIHKKKWRRKKTSRNTSITIFFVVFAITFSTCVMSSV